MGNIKINLRELGWDGVDWIDLARSCEHGNEPSSSTTFGEFSRIDKKLNFARRNVSCSFYFSHYIHMAC